MTMFYYPIPIATEVMTLFHLTNMNILVLNSKGNLSFTHVHHSLPNLLVESQKNALINIHTAVLRHPGECCLYTTKSGLTYMGGAYDPTDFEAALFVIGPFLRQMPDLTYIRSLFHDHDHVLMLNEFFSSLPLVSQSTLQSFLNVLQHIRSVTQVPLHSINETEEEKTEPVYRSYSSLEQQDRELIDLRYVINNSMMHAIKKGDHEALKTIMEANGNLYDFSERYPNQPVRATKNMLIILNTTFRIAAENGGVPPFFLHHLSEKFAIQIERIDSIDTLNKLLATMCQDYCDLVKKRAVSGYSSLVQKALHLLMIDYSKSITIQTVATECHVHPAHLSRQFKKETGLNITQYLHHLRIEEAKLMLQKDQTSIDWIAGAVGFEDAGYFSRVFKKQEGVTPTQYRNNWQELEMV
jgi:two-component system, response regulator YesN